MYVYIGESDLLISLEVLNWSSNITTSLECGLLVSLEFLNMITSHLRVLKEDKTKATNFMGFISCGNINVQLVFKFKPPINISITPLTGLLTFLLFAKHPIAERALAGSDQNPKHIRITIYILAPVI